MRENHLNLDNLFTLDFLNLRLRTFADIEPHDKLRGRIELISSICPHFYTQEGIGLCNEKKVICPAWECEFINRCKKECIENCLVLNATSTFFTDFPHQMENSISILTEKIENTRKQIPDDVVVSWFSGMAEEGAYLALTRTPYELIEVIKIWEWLYNSYGRLDSFNLKSDNIQKYKGQLDTIWRCFLARINLENVRAKIKNRDAIIAFSKKAIRLLNQFEKRPTCLIEKQESVLDKAQKTGYPPLPKHDIQTFWTNQMVPVMRWC